MRKHLKTTPLIILLTPLRLFKNYFNDIFLKEHVQPKFRSFKTQTHLENKLLIMTNQTEELLKTLYQN